MPTRSKDRVVGKTGYLLSNHYREDGRTQAEPKATTGDEAQYGNWIVIIRDGNLARCERRF